MSRGLPLAGSGEDLWASQDPWLRARIDHRVGLRQVDRVVRREQVRVALWCRYEHLLREFGSGNFGPPARGSFTISRFVMMSLTVYEQSLDQSAGDDPRAADAQYEASHR